MKFLPKFEVEKFTKDVEEVSSGDAYFCLCDDEKTAFERTAKAINNGAKIVVSKFDFKVEQSVVVENPRSVFADECANLYGYPANKMTMVGVTGTNGKTTTTFLIAEILKSANKKVGVIGTNGVYFSGKHFESPLTTPDADFLHKTFREMLDAGIEYVVMEVSAHAIDQHRIDGIMFDVGVLTNITQDHLDYFKTFKEYEKTKLSFISSKHIKSAIVCADDKSAQKLADIADVPLMTYGLKNPSDIFAIDECYSLDGTHFVANLNDEIMKIRTNLIGEYNVLNSLAALGVCQKLGLKKEELIGGLRYVLPVEGRFNVINLSGKYVVIDFAHTPDGLKNVLETARTLTDKKVIVVFGCGGNRDSDKRHKMGLIAEEYADVVMLTSDNPRYENPNKIIKDIEKGMKKEHLVEVDRKKAVEKAIDFAHSGDIVIIAGKGAEKYQEIQGKKLKYNDYDVVYNIFKDSDPQKFHGTREKL